MYIYIYITICSMAAEADEADKTKPALRFF